jgi:Cu/Ag efflux pump CusA
MRVMNRFFAGVLQFRLLLLAAAIGVLSFGVLQLRSAPIDVLPEFTPPYAEIQTEALGLSAEEVEALITVPLEATMLNGVEGVDIIRSESLPGISSIVLVFERGTDIYQARQLVEERLAQAHALPNVSKPPTLLQPLSSSNRVLMIGMSTTELTPIEQSVIARWTVKPRLMGVAGVANVSIWGMRDQQLQVQVDPQQLRRDKVTLSQIIATAGNAQVVSPLSFLRASTPGTGGFVETPQQRLQVRHLLEKIADPAELAKVPVEGTKGALQLGDVSKIKVDHQPLIGDAVVNGVPGLVLVVEKFPGVSTPEVTKNVKAALETLRPGLTGIDTTEDFFRPADYIGSAKANLAVSLAIGFGLLLLAMAAIGFDWRGAVLLLVTVPLSIISAALVLDLLGQGMNALVLAGLGAAVAIVVDEAIAPTSSVLSRLRAREGDLDAEPAWVAVQEGSGAARRPLIYATVIGLLAILPVAVLQGRPGAFFTPMVLAFVLAVVAAMVVALTVAPALTSLLFAPGRVASHARLGRLTARYEGSLGRFTRTLRPALLVAAALGLLAAVTIPFVSTSLVPEFADRNVLVRLEGQPGVSNKVMTRRATEVTKALQAVPGVTSAGATIGRAVTGDRVANVSSGDLWVAIGSKADYHETLAAITEAVRGIPDLTAEVTTYSAQRLRDVGSLTSGANTVTGNGLDVLTGLDQPVAVRMFGQDQAVLAQQAKKIQQLMAGVEGVVDARVDVPPTQPTIEIEVDLDKAQKAGVSPGDVRRTEATLLQGIQVGSVFEQQKVFDVIVQGVPATRQSVAAIRNLLMDRPGGGYVTLGDVADVRIVQTPSVISRDAVSRRLDIVAGVDGRPVSDVVNDLKTQLGTLSFPMEYHAEVVARTTADEIGLGRAVGFGVAGVVAAFLLFQAAFRSWQLAAVAVAAVPLALFGGVLATVFTGFTFTLGSMLGFLALLGLAVRFIMTTLGKIQLADREELRAQDGSDIRSFAAARFGPVLTTVLAVAALALPFVVLGSRPGLEILHPLAVVLLGGLVTTFVVTLFLLPAAYLHLVTRPGRRQRLEAEDELDMHDDALAPAAGTRGVVR